MKLTVVLLFASMMTCLASVHAQRLNLEYKNAQLKKVLVEISRQSGYTFIYEEKDLNLSRPVTIRVDNKEVMESLEILFKRQPLQFQIKGRSIAIVPSSRLNSNLTETSGAQQKTVQGRVTNENGEALPGVSVQVKGTTAGTVTNGEGAYTINVPSDNSVLVFNYIGFAPQERSVAGQTNLSVRLREQANSLDELVVVSYGTQKRREITGSVATLDAKTLEDMPVNQFGQQLQGKIAGVNVAQTSGQPGRGVSFRIRGAASLATDYQPLFVVDGMPITGSINNINPDEIESYSVLKDASATSLYGSRAANGVVMITTKRAKNGESRIEFNSNYGLQKLNENRVPKMMNATQFATFMKQRFEDRAKYEGFTGAVPAEYQGDVTRHGVGTDWYNLLTQTAPIESYSLNSFSARERSSSAVMLNYQSQEGVIINTGTKLFSARLNQDLYLADNKIKLGVNLAPSYRLDHNNRISSDGVNGYYQRIFESSPLVSPYQPDGTYTIGAFSSGMVAYVNPLALLKESQDDYITTRILGNVYGDYKILPSLTLKANLGVDKGAEFRSQYSPQVAVNTVATLPTLSTALSSSVDNYSYTGELFLNYEKTFAENHHVEGLIGYGVQKFDSKSNNVSGNNFPSDDVYYLSAAGAITGGSSSMTQYALLSEIARLNYNYKGKYFLQASARRDGSSRFGQNRKFGWFPAVSAGWVISDEGFMQGFDKIDLLKVRASYGITGNNTFGNYTAISTLNRYNYLLNGVPVQTQTVGGLGNTDLAWERNKQLDLGIDLELLKNRISFTYDYYHKMSDGLIQVRQIPRASGFANIQFNIGQFEFWGHEFALSTVNTTGALQWTTNFNLSVERNEIKNLVDPGYIRRNNTVSSDYFRHQVGRRLGEFYGFVHLGLYKDAEDLANSAKYQSGNSRSDVGTLKMKDLNGDGVIDDVNDRTFIGDPTPDFTFGITNRLNYKDFDLSITMSGQVGGDILTPGKWAYLTNMDGSRVPLAAALDYWRSPENPGSGVYPRTLANTTVMGRQVNSQWVEDGTYLAANNISLGYRFKTKENWILKNFRLYASVQQAFVITGYSGYTPQIALGGNDALGGLGVDENAYPVPRTFSIGFTSNFK